MVFSSSMAEYSQTESDSSYFHLKKRFRNWNKALRRDSGLTMDMTKLSCSILQQWLRVAGIKRKQKKQVRWP